MSLCEEIVICTGFDVDDGKSCGPRSFAKRNPITTCACTTASLVTSLVLIIFAATAGKVYLERDQQAVLHQRHQMKKVVNGPGFVKFDPFSVSAEVRTAILLTELSYVLVKDSVLGTKKTVAGPGLFFPGNARAYDEVDEPQPKVILGAREYVKVLNRTSGVVHIVKGPTAWVPQPMEEVVIGSTADGVQSAVQLLLQQYVKLEDSATGKVRIERGEQLVFPTATEVVVGGVSNAIVLSKQEYIKVRNKTSGEMSTVKGPTAWVPQPTEEIVTGTSTTETTAGVHTALQLLQHQYVKLVDSSTGRVRVEVGEQLLFPTATESLMQTVTSAINIDHNTAALVLSRQTGQTSLVTRPGLYFPGAYEEVVEERPLIKVEPHEVAIVRDNYGAYTFYNGNATGQGTSFFLPPHSQLVSMMWSSGGDDTSASDAGSKVAVTKIDLRAQYAFFQYTVRTSDNVELLLRGNIFWQVVDVPTLVERTADPQGDVWYHARSALIQAVSGATLEQFMSNFNNLVTAAAAMDAEFYVQRGVKLHTLEVTGYECKDATQARVLQEIIQETTNRINRLQQQRSANEVEAERLASELQLESSRKALVLAKAENDQAAAVAAQQATNEVQRAKLISDVALEQSRKDLVDAKTINDRTLATATGEAVGLRLAIGVEKFFDELNETLPDEGARLSLYKFFNQQETATQQLGTTTKNLGSGSANLFLTPSDLNLRLDMPSTPVA